MLWNLSWFIRLILGIGAVGYAASVYALPCNTNDPSPYTATAPEVTVGVDFYETRILTSYFTTQSKPAYRDCSGVSTITNYAILKSQSVRLGEFDGYSILETNLKGIGILLDANAALQGQSFGPFLKFIGPELILLEHTDNYLFTNVYFQGRMRLVQTGPIEGGTLSGKVAEFTWGSPQLGYQPANNLMLNPSIVNVVSCNVTESALKVRLGDINASLFTAVGVQSQTKTFKINIQCQQDASVYMTFTAQKDANYSGDGVIELGSGSTAQGVGILVTRSGSPVELNKRKVIYYKTDTVAKVIKFKASYISTGTVQPGSANATASLTFSYL